MKSNKQLFVIQFSFEQRHVFALAQESGTDFFFINKILKVPTSDATYDRFYQRVYSTHSGCHINKDMITHSIACYSLAQLQEMPVLKQLNCANRLVDERLVHLDLIRATDHPQDRDDLNRVVIIMYDEKVRPHQVYSYQAE